MEILVVEDDLQIMEFLQQGLTAAGFAVDVATDGASGLELAMRATYDAMILDIMLPGIDGLELLQRLRAADVHTPVLILSAKRSVDDRVIGLRTGGDDYLTKPFAFAELLARIEGLIRRAGGSEEPVRLSFADLILELLSRRVFRGEKEIKLQAREFAILEYFVRNHGHVVTRTQLLQHVWGYNFNPATNVVEVHVCKLREKIEIPGKPKLLETVRGVGYILTEKEDAETFH
jgi:two-component system, OmpR family, response regulator